MSKIKKIRKSSSFLGINGSQAIFVVQKRFKDSLSTDMTETDLIGSEKTYNNQQ